MMVKTQHQAITYVYIYVYILSVDEEEKGIGNEIANGEEKTREKETRIESFDHSHRSRK